MISQNCEMQGSQWYRVSFVNEVLWKKVLGTSLLGAFVNLGTSTSLLTQGVLISSIKPISSSISLKQRTKNSFLGDQRT